MRHYRQGRAARLELACEMYIYVKLSVSLNYVAFHRWLTANRPRLFVVRLVTQPLGRGVSAVRCWAERAVWCGYLRWLSEEARAYGRSGEMAPRSTWI